MVESTLRFFIQTRDEVAKVTWPTQAQIIRMTMVVIIISLAIAAYVGGLDYVFTQLTTILIK